MQVAVGGTMADVSDDGRDIQLPAPAPVGKALVLPFPEASHAKASVAGVSLVAPMAKPDGHVPAVAVEGPAAATLILVALVAAVAVTRFVARAGGSRDEAPSRLHAPLDDAAFLQRYGRTP